MSRHALVTEAGGFVGHYLVSYLGEGPRPQPDPNPGLFLREVTPCST